MKHRLIFLLAIVVIPFACTPPNTELEEFEQTFDPGSKLLVPKDYTTIQAAIDAASDLDTILISPGVYQENLRFLGKKIKLLSLFGAKVTTLDGGNKGTVVTMGSGCDSSTMIKGFTIKNGRAEIGGGLYIVDADPTLINLIITNNIANGFEHAGGRFEGLGGGIYFNNSRSIMHNIIVAKDTARSGIDWVVLESSDGRGAGIYCSNSNLTLNNVVIYNNTSRSDGDAPLSPGGLSGSNSLLTIRNSIIYGNNETDFWFISSYTGITYSDISSSFSGTGNINLDPMFVNPAIDDYHLLSGSPCINSGDPGSAYNDINGSRNDMGAYGGPYGSW